MINIVEKSPTKLSGLSSLYISFKYNPEIIPIIKSWDVYSYDKKSYTWELPVTALAYLLDSLTYIDDITLSLLKEDHDEDVLIPKLTYKTKPFDHQLETVKYGLDPKHSSFLLLDQPGLGKSAQMIYLAEELKEQKGLQHCLIICGVNTLKSNWKKEIKTHSNLSCRVVGEKINRKGNISYTSIKQRAAELMNPLDAFFIILNIEMLRSDEIIQALRTTKNKIDMVVFDECHKCLESNTLIDTDKGKLRIKDIKPGMTVLSYNENLGNFEYKKVLNIFNNGITDKLIELNIQDDDNKTIFLRCTPDHLIYTRNRGFVKAKNLKYSDDIVTK